MNTKVNFFYQRNPLKWFSLLCLLNVVRSQYNPYFSLQSAVEDLQQPTSDLSESYRDALSLPSKPAFRNHQNYPVNDEENDFPRYSNGKNLHSLNKELARFLTADNRYNRNDLDENIDLINVANADNQLPWRIDTFDGRFDHQMNNKDLNIPSSMNQLRNWYNREEPDDVNKRSGSVFRERSSNDFQDLQYPIEIGSALATNPELSEQFLREISQAENQQHEQQYEKAIQNNKYHQLGDNQLDDHVHRTVPSKRLRVPPYYMLMQKKRSYPVLPWLPYSGPEKTLQKRFVIAKRSTQNNLSENKRNPRTTKSLEKELSSIFRQPSSVFLTSDGIQKRSTEPINEPSHSHSPTAPKSFITPTLSPISTEAPLQTTTAQENITEELQSTLDPAKIDNSTTNHHHHHYHNHHQNHHQENPSHQNTSSEESTESHEDKHSQEESDEHDEHDDDEEENDEDVEEETDKTLSSINDSNDNETKAETKNSHAFPLHLNDGNLLKRHKKSIDWSQYFGLDRKKKSTETHKSAPLAKRNADNKQDAEMELQDLTWNNLNVSKLNNMNQKLQAIEDSIIGDTIKYTGSHEGIDNPQEIERLKDHVLSRLATVYSLEKLRRALMKLRLIAENQNHLQNNLIENDMDKRNEHDSNGNTSDLSLTSKNASEDITKERMKKSNSYPRYHEVSNDFGESKIIEDGLDDGLWPKRMETLNDAYLGNKNYILGTNQCPIIETMAERCRSLDLLIGDLNQDLLTLCGIHQICYLCGTTRVACDYQFLEDADAVCGASNRKCQAATRTLLLILRGSPGTQLGPRECVKNPCLYSAMREIGL